MGASENLPPLLAELIVKSSPVDGEKTSVNSSAGLRNAIIAELNHNRPKVVEEHLRSWLARVLQLPESRIDAEHRLTDLGIDSLMAIELRKKVWTELGVTIDLATLLRGPTLRELSAKLITQIMSSSTEQAFAPSPFRGAHRELIDRLKDEQPDALASKIHKFSEDTVDALLQELNLNGDYDG